VNIHFGSFCDISTAREMSATIIIQSSGSLRLAIVEGFEVSKDRVGKVRPQCSANSRAAGGFHLVNKAWLATVTAGLSNLLGRAKLSKNSPLAHTPVAGSSQVSTVRDTSPEQTRRGSTRLVPTLFSMACVVESSRAPSRFAWPLWRG